MRNHILLLSTAVLLAACADDHPSAPTSRSVASRAAGDAAVSSTAPSSQAKPTDQVGFTKVTEVMSPNVHAGPGDNVVASVACPAGSVVVGGSFRLIFFNAGSTPPWIFKNDSDGQNGWSVTIVNQQPGAFDLTYRAVAYCAS